MRNRSHTRNLEYLVFFPALLIAASMSCSAGDDADSVPEENTIGSVSQAYVGSTFISNKLSAVCLDVIGAPGVASGTLTQTYPCENSGLDAWGGPTDQYWDWDYATGNVKSRVAPNKCLATTGTSNGSQLQIADCVNDASQHWSVTYEGFIVHAQTGKCIDISGAPGTVNHLAVQLWDCEYSGYNADNGSVTDQTWNVYNPGAGGYRAY